MTDDGRVDGVVVRGRDGRERTLGARAVVIASGGFEGSREMLGEYLGERASELPLIAPGLANNRGEGIRMALEVGADTAGQFDMFHGEPVDPRATKPDPVFFPFVYGIVVNGRAERFFDEGRDSFEATFEVLGYEIWRNQQQTAFFIGDQTTLGLERIDEVIVTDVPAVTAETIGELAVRLGLDPGALEQTVAEYNAAVGPEEFDPYVFDGKSTRRAHPAEVELGFPARLAAVRRVPAHVRDHVHVRRYSHGQLGAGGRPVRCADPGPLRGRRGHGRLLQRVPGGDLGAAQPHLRAPGGRECCARDRWQPLGAALPRAAEEPAVQFRRVARRANDDQEDCRWRVSRPCGAPSTWRSSARR